MQMIDITPLLEAFLVIAGILLLRQAIPWLKCKTGREGWINAQMVYDMLVAAAEQLFTSEQGTAKRDYVESRLTSLGMSVNVDRLEDAVLRLHQSIKRDALWDTLETTVDLDVLEEQDEPDESDAADIKPDKPPDKPNLMNSMNSVDSDV
ncbi:hypothetical protein FACS1894184_14450 [Clostridia bacterium]|nr:hypothetical protein FACS1894184_14450 [Clostridia bacterium]